MTDLVIALCQERKGSYPYLHRLEPHMTCMLVKRIITGIKQTRTLVYIVNQPEHIAVIFYNTFCFSFIHVGLSPEIEKKNSFCIWLYFKIKTPSINAQCRSIPIKIMALIRNADQCRSIPQCQSIPDQFCLIWH